MSDQVLVDVCALGDLGIDSVRKVDAGGQDIALVRCDEGVFAIGNRCSHADVDLSEGEVEGCALECWLHGSQFDLRTGMPLSPPAVQPVPTYTVVIEGEGDAARVLIDPQPHMSAE
ncbi:MAG: non-heme iron oxygenase ferredoxin subunit [Actinomycetota bacterium]|nr:non-heme iron oxygenase ferredoxin subunit [Actinomycetota bacterium]